MDMKYGMATGLMGLVISASLIAAPVEHVKNAHTKAFDSHDGTVQVGTDNAGNSIYMGYRIKGKNDGRPVLIFMDGYIGLNSWKHVQHKFSQKYYTIAFDNLGYGTSSKNLPTDMDGINGNIGYSYRQQAYFAHKAMEALDPQGPIIFVGVDTMGDMAMWYVKEYANSTYPITKLMMEDTSVDPVVSDDPCTMAYLNTATMQQVVNYYTFDPVAAVTAFLGGSFATANCPEVQQQIDALSIPYASSAPAAVFSRLALGTYTEDLTPLMADINIPVLNLYGSTAESAVNARRSISTSFVGNFSGFSNPAIPGTCNYQKPYVDGFKNGRFITYPGHGTDMHLTSFDNFSKDLENFVTGNDEACSIFLPD